MLKERFKSEQHPKRNPIILVDLFLNVFFFLKLRKKSLNTIVNDNIFSL